MAGLREAGHVRSIPGPGGGWELTRTLAELTLGAVYRAAWARSAGPESGPLTFCPPRDAAERTTARSVNALPVPRPAAASGADGVIALFREFMAEIALDPAAPTVAGYVCRAVDEELSHLDACYLSRPRQGFWVIDAPMQAQSSGVLLGAVGVQEVDAATAELRRMMVRSDHRRVGLGRLLLAHAERFARAAGYERMGLGTSSLQPAAIALYRRAGYTLESRTTEAQGSARAVAGVERLRFGRSLSV